MELTRRAFLGLTGLIATTAGAVENFIKHKLLGLPPPAEDEVLSPREPDAWRPSVCQLCPAGCGVVARVVNGHVVKLDGLPGHPVNRGTLCPRGLAGLIELYHPDRILQPLKRVGERGEGRFEPIRWDEALQLVVSRLQELRQRGGPHRAGWLSGSSRGLSRQLTQHFLRAFGSPHDLELGPPSGALPVDAFRLMVDQQGEPIYDLAQANFVLSFGIDWLQAYPSPVEASRAYGLLRRGRVDRRVRIVQVEPRLSVTAAKSDEWIPIRPGQEGWLALGIAHVLIRERFFHEPFVKENASGFEEFVHFVESHAAVESVAERTGVPAETIDRLAREFGLKKGLALGTRTDLLTQWAVTCLNGLVGNLDARGGILRRWEPPGLSLPPNPSLDYAAEELPARIASGQPLPLELLLISQANPCFLSPSPSRWVEALRRVPFVVTFSSFLDETALQADLILPLTTALEQWQFVPAMTSDSSVVLNISQPVIPPRGESRPLEEILMQLASALGPPLDEAFPWTSLEQLVMERTSALYEAKQGALLSQIGLPGQPPPEEEELPTGFEEFWEMVLARGGLAWPAEAAPWPEFHTSSGRFEFFPQKIRTALEQARAPLFDDASGAQTSQLLQLYLYTPLSFLNGYGAHLPHLQQIAGSQIHEAWETWVEIHPNTAAALSIRDGEWVWVASSHGKIRAKVRWYEGIALSVIAIPLGLGHTGCGRWAKGIGENPASLVGLELDPQTGQPLWQRTRVQVWKV